MDSGLVLLHNFYCTESQRLMNSAVPHLRTAALLVPQQLTLHR